MAETTPPGEPDDPPAKSRKVLVLAAVVMVVLGCQIAFGVRMIWRKLHDPRSAKTVASQSALTGEVAIRIAADGQVFLNGVPAGGSEDRILPGLGPKLAALCEIRDLPPARIQVHLYADAQASEARLAEVLTVLRQAGYDRLNLHLAARE